MSSEFVAEQTGQLDQLPRVGAQEVQREGVAQRVGRHRDALDMRTLPKAADDRLDRADRQRGAASAQEQSRLGAGMGALLEVPAQGASRRGVEGDLPLPASLAVANTEVAGALTQLDVGKMQHADLADAETGLDEQLHEGVVAASMTVAGGAGGAQQAVNLALFAFAVGA